MYENTNAPAQALQFSKLKMGITSDIDIDSLLSELSVHVVVFSIVLAFHKIWMRQTSLFVCKRKSVIFKNIKGTTSEQ